MILEIKNICPHPLKLPNAPSSETGSIPKPAPLFQIFSWSCIYFLHFMWFKIRLQDNTYSFQVSLRKSPSKLLRQIACVWPCIYHWLKHSDGNFLIHHTSIFCNLPLSLRTYCIQLIDMNNAISNKSVSNTRVWIIPISNSYLFHNETFKMSH